MQGFTYGNAADDLDEMVRLGNITQSERVELSEELFLAWTAGAKYRTRRLEVASPLNEDEDDLPAWVRVKKLMGQFSISAGQACELRDLLSAFGMLYLIYDGWKLIKTVISERGFDGFVTYMCLKYGFMYEERENSDDAMASLIRTYAREQVRDEEPVSETSSGSTKVINGLTAQQIAHWPMRMKTLKSLHELRIRAINRSKDGSLKMDRYWWNIFWAAYHQRKAELA